MYIHTYIHTYIHMYSHTELLGSLVTVTKVSIMKSTQVVLVVVSLCLLTETNAKYLRANQRGELTQESLILDIKNFQQPAQQNDVQSEDTEECSQVLTCADPVTDPHHRGPCSSMNCDNSKCKFRGCVHYGAFGPQWMPDPCTICNCQLKREVCTKIECEESLECYGYPTGVKEGECCPSCDFGVPENECGVIPTGYKSLYTALGEQNCQKDVLLHGCNKNYIAGKDGKFYQCKPVIMTHTVEMGEDCKANIHQVTYTDTAHCTKEEISPDELPQDLDFEPRKCTFYVNPQPT